MTSPIDYQSLLARYMAVVAEQGGTTFVRDCCAPRFSPRELEALDRADDASVDLLWPNRGDHA